MAVGRAKVGEGGTVKVGKGVLVGVIEGVRVGSGMLEGVNTAVAVSVGGTVGINGVILGGGGVNVTEGNGRNVGVANWGSVVVESGVTVAGGAIAPPPASFVGVGERDSVGTGSSLLFGAARYATKPTT